VTTDKPWGVLFLKEVHPRFSTHPTKSAAIALVNKMGKRAKLSHWRGDRWMPIGEVVPRGFG